jgi:pimeloyl-ACP methyl ester carboxylesterase
VRDQFEKIKMLRWMFEPPKDMTAEEMMNIFDGMIWSPEFYKENHERLNSYIPKYPALPSTLKCHYEATIMHDTCDRLEKISAKTLIIHGSQDGLLYPDSAYYFAEKIPNSELFIIEDARHGVLIEKWNLIYKKLKEFINP